MRSAPPLFAVLVVIAGLGSTLRAAEVPPKTRTFDFTYAGKIQGVAPGKSVRVWLPVPQTDATQRAEVVSAAMDVRSEPRFGNRIASFTAAAGADGTVPFSATYRITRTEVTAPMSACPVPAGATMSDPAALLKADAKVPIGGTPTQTLLAGKTLPDDPDAAAQVLYDVVDDHMQYRKDNPGWGTGDATWACNSRFGNCTDFHSLFISLARTEHLPSVFQIGFPIGDKPAGAVKGYHCWAWYKSADGWSPVDISEANQHPAKRAYFFGHLDADRVAFTVGRDLDLVPKQAGPPLNFFVYPYAEVDGIPVPQDRIEKSFGYAATK